MTNESPEGQATIASPIPPTDRPARDDHGQQQWLCWGLLLLAVVLRVIRYAHDHGLWLDEAYLALNLIHRSFAELTVQLDYEQYAPIGFLFVMKSIVATLGSSDYVFRLVPLFTSLVSVYLYFEVAKRVLKPTALPLALAFFALSYPLLIYAAETKPYGSDATIALALTLLGLTYRAKPTPRVIDVASLALAGALAVWMSFPAAFVLAGVGLTLGAESLRRRDRRSTLLLCVAVSAWLLSFAAQASMVAQGREAQLSNSDLHNLRDYYAESFLPWPPYPASVVEWLMNFLPTVVGFFTSEVAAGIGVFAFLMGFVAFAANKRCELAMLMLPLAAALAVSTAHLYPLTDRFTLFTGPALLLLISAGFDEVRTRVGNRGRTVWILLLAVILFQPTLRAVKQSIHLDRHGDARDAVARLDREARDGDIVYLYWTGIPVYRLYSSRPLPEDNMVEGGRSERWTVHARDLDRLYGNSRVWVLFSFNAQNNPAGRTVRDELERHGTLLDSFESGQAALYLFDLSGEHRITQP